MIRAFGVEVFSGLLKSVNVCSAAALIQNVVRLFACLCVGNKDMLLYFTKKYKNLYVANARKHRH